MYVCLHYYSYVLIHVINSHLISTCTRYTIEASMDYETVTRTLTFSNSTEQIVPVLINADEITENMESFTAMLTNPTPSGSAFITTSTATINIIDQEGSAIVL